MTDKIQARIVTDSVFINCKGQEKRLISIQTKSPKFIDCEIEKHRAISSNSSSSRALSSCALLEKVFHDPYIPQDIRYKEGGMQGYTKVEGLNYLNFQTNITALSQIILEFIKSNSMQEIYHKQHVNRYIEAYVLQDKILTANYEAWQDMLGLRLSKYADPSIQEWAGCVNQEIEYSNPLEIEEGEWHLPYVNKKDKEDHSLAVCKAMSVARCARVSYSNEGKEYPVEKEIAFATRLEVDKHFSPFEHQATPLTFERRGVGIRNWPIGMTAINRISEPLSGNFNSWIQNRQTL